MAIINDGLRTVGFWIPPKIHESYKPQQAGLVRHHQRISQHVFQTTVVGAEDPYEYWMLLAVRQCTRWYLLSTQSTQYINSSSSSQLSIFYPFSFSSGSKIKGRCFPQQRQFELQQLAIASQTTVKIREPELFRSASSKRISNDSSVDLDSLVMSVSRLIAILLAGSRRSS